MKTMEAQPITQPEDISRSRAWAQRCFSSAAALPISFVLNGQMMRGIPEAWQPTTSRRWIDANITETVFEGQDAGTGLHIRVELTEYRDYPVVEWVAWFSNRGRSATPVIRDILALDGVFAGASPVLHHCNGDFCSAEGYTPEETPLRAGATLDFAPRDGRPSDGAFPYYRVAFEDGGISLAIGWPGQWAASFGGTACGVQVRAGQERTNLRLLPGESIRTPRMTALFWTGDASRGVNLWRRWYLAHILPRPNGQPLRPLLALCGTDEGEEFTGAIEENQLRYIEKFQKLGIHPDVWWIDAGWYPCRNEKGERRWGVTGNWRPDPERFPRGLKPVSDCAARYGADLLIWFEPERVRPGTQLDLEHPEWLSKIAGQSNGQLMLSKSECRQWLTDHVCKLIQENGIKIYRQDHNFTPLEHWRKDEAEDRQGLKENLHVQGYLRYWDDLIERNPGLWMDSCASGGRRNDLETMRRAVPLHHSDYGYGEHAVKLAFHRTLYAWIPYFKEHTLSWDIGEKGRFDNQVDSFSFHCGMAAMLFPTLDIRRDDYDYALARGLIAVWRRAADLLLYGDYYPHTPFHRSAEQWVAWQFDRPETGCGFVQGIRLPGCPQATLTVQPKGILPEARYILENAESGETMDIAGSDLAHQGITFTLPARSGAIWFYRRADSLVSR